MQIIEVETKDAGKYRNNALRKQHLENGNHYDLDFDNGEEMGFEVVEEVDDIDMDSLIN
jgi:hypothetical protein